MRSLWLSPIYKSPMRDFGYDVSDFRDVDPLFGTMEDFDGLLSDAKAKGQLTLEVVSGPALNSHVLPWLEPESWRLVIGHRKTKTCCRCQK